MDNLYTILIYPLQRIAALLFSMVIADGVSVGALMVAALLLMVLFRALVGLHLSVFNNTPEDSEDEQIERGIKRRRINERIDEKAGPRRRWRKDVNGRDVFY